MPAKRGNLLDLSSKKQRTKLIKMDCILAEKRDRDLLSLAYSSGKEPSLLMNEALADLIMKYQAIHKVDIINPDATVKEP